MENTASAALSLSLHHHERIRFKRTRPKINLKPLGKAAFAWAQNFPRAFRFGLMAGWAVRKRETLSIVARLVVNQPSPIGIGTGFELVAGGIETEHHTGFMHIQESALS